MIDLHTHTTHSDSDIKVKDLLEEANKRNISILSITDHNTVTAYDELEYYKDIFLGKILNGVEITTTYNGEIIEILGYGFDMSIMKDILPKKVLSFEEKQIKEFKLIKSRYEKIGVKFDISDIIFDPKKESSRTSFKKSIMKYPSNISFCYDKRSLQDNRHFTRLEVFNPLSQLYVDFSSLFPSVEETINIIHLAGGKAFLAHPYEYSATISNALEKILESYPLDGLECFHPSANENDVNHLIDLCKKYNIYMSGGSDFHGTIKNKKYFGTMLDLAVVEPWISNYLDTNLNNKR